MLSTRQRIQALGTACTWFAGIMLGISVLMISGLLVLVLTQGLSAFWPKPLWLFTLHDGKEYLGYIHKREPDAADPSRWRYLVRTGNRDLYGNDFVWIQESQIAARELPEDVVVAERLEWGPFHGLATELRMPGQAIPVVSGLRPLSQELQRARRRLQRIRHMEREEIGALSTAMEQHRLALRKLELQGALGTPVGMRQYERNRKASEGLQERYNQIAERLKTLREEDASHQLVLQSIEGREKVLPLSAVVRVYPTNALGLWGKWRVYLSRFAEFVWDEPREANAEGGVAPAIFGTVMMSLLMVIFVVPLGVMAALYLHEYAKQGPLVSIVRIAVNNLAGVPSIVFGVFGLGFFCYLIGGTIDSVFFEERLPTPTFGGGGILWASLTLALLTVPIVIVATEEALVAVPKSLREASLALGATKFQTIAKVVLPAALPGILTGAILAMARGAGEVAPLMITGVVKLAPELPVDWTAPFLHLERRFMHLGFHIYDVGFQSPNVEAAKPMVFMTTLLLVGIVLCLNMAAMSVRTRLRERFQGAKV